MQISYDDAGYTFYYSLKQIDENFPVFQQWMK